MKILNLHSWEVTPKEASKIQLSLAKRVLLSSDSNEIRKVAGADIAVDLKRGVGIAGVVVYQYPDLEELERVFAVRKLSFPYIPGLLSFREAPILLEALRELQVEPDLVFFDGQGIAHPRRLGLASHLGILLDKPTVGCAKSRLVGEYHEPGQKQGDYTLLVDRGETIGAVLRTRENVKPIFVSPGHKIDLENAVRMVLACCDGYRIPKPTREADHWVGELKRSRKS